jgi:hypothetical protein
MVVALDKVILSGGDLFKCVATEPLPMNSGFNFDCEVWTDVLTNRLMARCIRCRAECVIGREGLLDERLVVGQQRMFTVEHYCPDMVEQERRRNPRKEDGQPKRRTRLIDLDDG